MLANSVFLSAFAIILLTLTANTVNSIESITLEKVTLSSDHTRITIISNATVGQFPHQVSVRKRENGHHICGGSIISNRWILTAARCVVSRVPYAMVAVVGAVELSNGGRQHEIVLSIQHPNFKHNQLTHDIALLRTQHPIVFNEFVRPIGLPTANQVVEISGFFAGWGIQGGNFDDVPDHLQYVETMIISPEMCKNLLPRTVLMDLDGIICRYDGSTFRETGKLL